jgi:hypothetical protein
MPGRTAVLFISTIFVGFCLCSCAAFSPRHRLYSGPLLPRGDVAILANQNEGVVIDIMLMQVDEQDRLLSSGIVEILPGRHILRFREQAGLSSRMVDANVELDTKAGHIYIYYQTNNGATAELKDLRWWPHVEDITDQIADPKWLEVKTAIDKYWERRRANE